MTTDISIASQALVLLGDNPLSSFTDETDAAKLVAQRYPGLRKRLISSHPWRCMMTKAELTREAAAPIGEWAYSYIIPGEALGSGAQALFSSNGIDELPAKSYEVFGRRIYTNYKRVFTDQQSTADRWAGWTYGTPSEGGKGGYWAQCTTIDAQGQPNEQVQNDAFINARAGGWGPY
jgi:hypothetical protein